MIQRIFLLNFLSLWVSSAYGKEGAYGRFDAAKSEDDQNVRGKARWPYL